MRRFLQCIALSVPWLSFGCVTEPSGGPSTDLGAAIVQAVAEGITTKVERAVGPDLYAALEACAITEVFSLYPYPEGLEDDDPLMPLVRKTAMNLHGYPVIGHRVLEHATDKMELAALFALSIASKQDESVADCFEPRHGLRLAHDGAVFDLVVCFACEHCLVYEGGMQSARVLVSEKSSTEFTNVFRRLGLVVEGASEED
ncbi:MAG: hypothetical protein H6832_11880 [Planctomycetes bacterium]|nr:hypothetical protein [Planctomycetota bacterium]MCB9892685.1 hypothetical protein [Planctomycetota bacterium]MCB9919092.1 hypothetical protein [Planctomycetota bacterium]